MFGMSEKVQKPLLKNEWKYGDIVVHRLDPTRTKYMAVESVVGLCGPHPKVGWSLFRKFNEDGTYVLKEFKDVEMELADARK